MFQPEPTPLAGRKPPVPLPGYIHKVPSVLRPNRSDLPSPLKSPELMITEKPFHP